jgi:hypothetical protein
MEPLSVLVGYGADKLAELGEHLVRKHVIERWTRKRAIEFYREFCATLLLDNPSNATLQEMLDELLGDEARSELVFEAYRLVCLAKSKRIGPRIIAVLVAHIVQGAGVADDEEEVLLAAAEQLSDSELLSFSSELLGLGGPNQHGEITVTLDMRQIDSNYNDRRVEIGRGSLVEVYGLWAEKLRSLGLLTDFVSERTFRYTEDSERHIDADGSVREITWSVVFSSSSRRLAELVQRVANESAP